VLILIPFGKIGISGIVLNEATLADLKKQYPNHDVLVLDVGQAGAPSWAIVNYPRKYGKKEHEVGYSLDFPFDPTALTMNNEWDFTPVKFIAIAEKGEYKVINTFGDECRVIKVKRLFIDTVSWGEDIGELRIKDMRIIGIVKAFLGRFIPLFRYSY
jgi:hypothetical protein